MNLMHQQCPDLTEIDLEWPIKPLSRLNALNLIQLDDFLVLSKDLFCQSRNIMSDYDLAIHFNTVYVLVYDVFNRAALCTIRTLRASPHEKWCSAIIKLIEWIIKLVEQPQIIINIFNLSVNNYYKYIKILSPKFWKISNIFTYFQMSSSWRI